ncbi:signal peptidase I [Streptomyces sp. 3MP-14]|uniref:Signal peptidase I n=1 Tax=Streptomyces mimosae TaxID=2586635 RepID=A0A5N6A0P5_9ACTN|nr:MULTISPECIES: signal peptidase I [Streptomyces]KAB8161569.1 signal peptidase I [Streptomyces mimosae]KAB8173494.1 signal peptidase I [Streptomyces sp. 3MP-14]
MSGTPRRGGRIGRALSNVAVGLGCVLFLGGFVLAAFLYQPYTVPTDSMAPSVASGDRVLAERIEGHEVRRGDVVVFRDDTWGDLPMVKRVVGVGGDTVACCDEGGRLLVNGEPVEEPYLDESERAASPTGFDTEVPEGELFLLGDDRSDSLDSRSLLAEGEPSTVPRSAVSGRVTATVWPLDRLGSLPEAAGFADQPGGISGQGPLWPLVWATGGGAVLIILGGLYGPLVRLTSRSRRDGVRSSSVTHNEGTHG